MKTTTIFWIIFALSAVLMLAGCQKAPLTPASETACSTDADCACGTRITTGECFVGNKAFVDVEKQCPDFCTGIAGMFETRCVDNECKNVMKDAPTSCTTDNDCVPGQCCHPTGCVPGQYQPDCAAVSCDASCQPGTLDCGGYCECVNGQCIARLNDLAEEPSPEEKECQAASDCIPDACCHPTGCKPGKYMPECATVLCSMECRPGTMDCGGYCACDNGKCVAILNDLQ